MLQNKIIYELLIHICLGKTKKIYTKIIRSIFQIIKQHIKTISPLYLIETAIFYLLIPVTLYHHSSGSKILKGKFIKQSIIIALLSIIKYAKHSRTKQTIAYKLAIIFIQIYKKDHPLYKTKLLYLNKILNI